MFEKKELERIFSSFNQLNIMIIGDVMIDSYLWGKVERISPEAPVPVVSLLQRENRPGGAANVALNLQALGVNPILCSVIGNDIRSDQFLELLNENKLITDGIIKSGERPTTTKFRIMGNNAHMLRVDEETDRALTGTEFKELIKVIEYNIEKGVDAIIFEDYDKGVITSDLIKSTIELANLKNIPVVVDPKKRNFMAYGGLMLFKPNLKELREGLKIDSIAPDAAELKRAIADFIAMKKIEMVMVTLSEAGVFICYKDAQNKLVGEIIPAHIRNIADVSGAGDTVIALAAACLALKLTAPQMAALANLAGGLVCEEVGVVPIKKEELFDEAILRLAKP
jgi:D-glycero-beta-D-manno-heptose-7-phosphate kinase